MVDFSADIKECVATLNAGGTILYPTDTVWGIGCDASNAAAVDKVFALKRRPREKSLIVLLPMARDVLRFVAAPPPDIVDIIEGFEKPTTVVLDGALYFAENVIADDGSAAIRVPKDAFCLALLKRFGKPLVSTSANLSGEKPAAFFKEISSEIISGCDYVVRHRRGDDTPRTASSVVRIHETGEITVLRP